MASLSPIMEEILQGGGTVELTVTGSSMWPMLRHKVSRVRLAAAGELKVGDLPLYRRDNGKFILHRVVEVKDGRYACCGDNQWHVEQGLRQDQMMAVVTHFARGNRWVAVDNLWYRLYRTLWVAARPLRRLVFGGWGRVKRMLRRFVK